MMFHDLRQIADFHICRKSNLTARRILKTTNEFKNGGLAGSILADKPYLVILTYMKIDVIQQSEATIGYGQTID